MYRITKLEIVCIGHNNRLRLKYFGLFVHLPNKPVKVDTAQAIPILFCMLLKWPGTQPVIINRASSVFPVCVCFLSEKNNEILSKECHNSLRSRI